MKSVQIVVALGATVFGAGVLLYIYKRRKDNFSKPSDKDWQYAGTLEEIILYPIRSCYGIELNEASCKKNGIQCGDLKDRQLFLVDDQNTPLFAGSHPKMWQIKSKLIDIDEIEVTAPNMEPLVLNIHKITYGRKEVIKCYGGSSISVIECDSEYGNWFSKFLLQKESGLTLFVCPFLGKIPFRKNLDLNPYMVMVDESIKDLNNRLPNKVHHWQFRGNFLIKNTNLPAFSEDNWKWMRIGNETIFRYKAPCYRCILPNVNPFTCERSPEFEPLKTLKKYRMKPGQIEPEMGIYFNIHKEGVIKLGDEVYVII
ncbi:mitochondrial amidoxime reducing component 2-like [Episyrphus balteatus]|uniref:mitochondrial amidoxime reducing component 2-like n=1 Tax=Episyrphus balteatus TaxID=286459 RepID=UPI00248507A5|nr:mitochondrial amidoxime reducing component 2-like [Episyrphus balteatus]